ncbi:MAG: flagellar basal body rod protein FlgB [Dethiobacter sp.]|jgi:flagellar basal-body rod protein FlgB|nr:flagellar basal body rod protein FlgB [Dethiobacter sp.]
MNEIWSGKVFTYLVKGLDASALRQRVHAHNLANVNTPDFKRSYVAFEQILKDASVRVKGSVAAAKPGHIGRGEAGEGEAKVVRDSTTSMRSDGNNVDVDTEMTQLAINQLYYNALSQQVNDRLGVLRYVINEGRR